MNEPRIRPSDSLSGVRYEIRGRLARRAEEMRRSGREIIRLNIGNPALFGFRTPEKLREALIGRLHVSEGYCHQKGILPAREAVAMQQRARGAEGVGVEEVYIGNGVSELVDLALRALLNPGDEVLVPSPDYPLWTAAVRLNQGRAVHYPCPPDNGFQPDLDALAGLLTPRTRALVLINPNNPTGAVYDRRTLEAMVRLAERHRLRLVRPQGAMYAFVGINRTSIPHFDDEDFALALLDKKGVLLMPGTSFSTSYKDHFRITLLPDAHTLGMVFRRIEDALEDYAEQPAVSAGDTGNS